MPFGRTASLLLLLSLVTGTACQYRGRPADEPGATSSTQTPQDDDHQRPAPAPTSAPATQPASAPAEPARPQPDWTIFREAFEDKQNAVCNATWLGDNRFEIDTENIQRLTIDFTELPPGAPEKGPWLVTIDGQTIEFMGFKPRPGYTGLKRDLVRSPNGVWEIDRKRLYRPGE